MKGQIWVLMHIQLKKKTWKHGQKEIIFEFSCPSELPECSVWYLLGLVLTHYQTFDIFLHNSLSKHLAAFQHKIVNKMFTSKKNPAVYDIH